MVQVIKTQLQEKEEEYRRHGITDDQMIEAMKAYFHFQVRTEKIRPADMKPTANALRFLMELVEALVPGGVDAVIKRLREQRGEDET